MVILATIPAPVLAEGPHSLNLFDFSSETSHPLVALVINFILLAIIVYFILRKPLSKRFKDRHADLVQAIEEAKAAKERAETAARAAREKMARVDQEMESLRDEIVAAGKATDAHMVSEAEARAKRLIEDTRTLVDSEVARITQGIREEVVEQIVEAAKQLIRDKISEEDNRRLTREYLREMSAARETPLEKP